MLPADGHGGPSTVSGYLDDSDTGLPSDSSITERPYRTAFRLAAIGQPSLGVGVEQCVRHAVLRRCVGVLQRHARQPVDRRRGAGVGPAARHRRAAALHQQRESLELGRERVAARRTCTRTARSRTIGAQYVIEHIAIDNASLIAQYPLSQTRRIEFSTGLHALRLQHPDGNAGLQRRHERAHGPAGAHRR